MATRKPDLESCIAHPKLYQISAKALQLDNKNRMMLMLEDIGVWEPPGGRIEHGETIMRGLEREIREECGVGFHLLDERPVFTWVDTDRHGHWRCFIFYRIELESLDIRPSPECQEVGFFTPNEIAKLPKLKNMDKLSDHLHTYINQ